VRWERVCVGVCAGVCVCVGGVVVVMLAEVRKGRLWMWWWWWRGEAG
jgi:hypothetical protein